MSGRGFWTRPRFSLLYLLLLGLALILLNALLTTWITIRFGHG